jgi:hypothetical protein
VTARIALAMLMLLVQGAHAGEAALKAVCTKCHNLELVTSTPRSLEEWHDTLQLMVDRGAKGTDAQFDEILDVLHRNYTTINVNSADADELRIVLGLPGDVVSTIIARRAKQPFAGLDDLKSIPGVDAQALDTKSKLIFFK